MCLAAACYHLHAVCASALGILWSPLKLQSSAVAAGVAVAFAAAAAAAIAAAVAVAAAAAAAAVAGCLHALHGSAVIERLPYP